MNSRPHNLKSEQLENHLLREILPQYRPGERVPSEVEMARQLGTSRTTMHKVYFNLISRGLLYRQSGIRYVPGRSGGRTRAAHDHGGDAVAAFAERQSDA